MSGNGKSGNKTMFFEIIKISLAVFAIIPVAIYDLIKKQFANGWEIFIVYIVSLSLVLSTAIIAIILIERYRKRTSIISADKTLVPCSYGYARVCPAKMLIKTYSRNNNNIGSHMLKVLNTDNLKSERKLFPQSEVLEIEEGLKQGDEVWVFSRDLQSEKIFRVGDYVYKNLIKGVKYFYLYYVGRGHDEDTQTRDTREAMENIANIYGRNQIFWPLLVDKNRDWFGEDVLLSLCGSVIYKNKTERDAAEYDGYLSLRGGEDNESKSPIYFKMPNCMRQSYKTYFLEAMKRIIVDVDKKETGELEYIEAIFEKLNYSHFEEILNFINIHKGEYFILSDIDRLKDALADGFSYCIKNYENNEMLAFLAANLNDGEESLFKYEGSKYLKEDSVVEIGWAVVHQGYRKKRLLKRLITIIENKIFSERKQKIFGATIDPKNIDSLFAFIRRGYIAFDMKDIKGEPRLLLIKDISENPTWVNNDNCCIYNKSESIKMFQNEFSKGYVCNLIRRTNTGVEICFDSISGNSPLCSAHVELADLDQSL